MSSLASRRVRALVGLVVLLVPASITLVMAYQRRWLDDDGFINLRIARNVLDGHGPVFNIDERVEAGTSPLWLAVVSLLGGLGARLEDASVYTGIALTVLAVLLAQHAAMRLYAPPGSSLSQRVALVRGNGGGGAPFDTWLPLGALTIAVLPPIWDYASSGLETGLSLCWLALAYDVLVTRLVQQVSFRGAHAEEVVGSTSDAHEDAHEAAVDPATPAHLRSHARGHASTDPSLLAQLGAAALLGVGSLIRPELTLYALTFFALFLGISWHVASDRRRFLVRAACLIAAFAALPLAYQVFRMGYYGAVSPNTAIAKEAFLVNWDQGRCYLANYLDTYKLRVPLVGLLLLFVWRLEASLSTLRSRAWFARLLWLGVLLAPPLLGLFHALYVVRMGGDYMHARMFLPATFAALLPVAAVPLRLPLTPVGDAVQTEESARAAAFRTRLGHLVVAACSALVLGWCVLCARSLRVAVENQCGIGDERGWYARMAEVPNPVRIEQYEKHPFHAWGRGLVDTVRKACPEFETATEGSATPGCRLTHLTPDEAREVSPAVMTYSFAPTVDRRLLGQVSQGAMGISGFLLPDNVHLFDVHGLADPFVSRVELKGRGRPGHEKTLPVAWRLARYTAAAPGEDATIAAARRALRCGALETLEQAVRAPLDASRFFQNLTHAGTHTKMRIPSDPFDAEARYCHAPRWRFFTTVGEGGDAFRWLCPEGLALTGVRGLFNTSAGALSRVLGSCSDPAGSTQPPALSPSFGAEADAPFELGCPPGTRVVGMFGNADSVVHALGLSCAAKSDGSSGKPAAPTRTNTIGNAVGAPFEFVCPRGQSARALRGRAGALLDAIGFGCPADKRPQY